MRGKILLYTSLVIALIASMAMSGVVIAPPGTKVLVEPTSITGLLPGDTFSVDLNIYDVVGVNAWQVRLSFDSNMLKVLSVTEGPFMKSQHSTFFIWKVGPLGDYVILGCTFKAAYETSGSGLLATINFQAAGAGSTKLANEAKLLDVYGYTIETSTGNAEVGVHAVAEVTGRWEQYQRCPSDTDNTLYAKVANSAPGVTVTAYVKFDGLSMEGMPIKLTSAKATIGPGQEVTLSATFDTLKYGVGSYDFTARAYFSYDGLTYYRGEAGKTISFVVVP